MDSRLVCKQWLALLFLSFMQKSDKGSHRSARPTWNALLRRLTQRNAHFWFDYPHFISKMDSTILDRSKFVTIDSQLVRTKQWPVFLFVSFVQKSERFCRGLTCPTWKALLRRLMQHNGACRVTRARWRLSFMHERAGTRHFIILKYGDTRTWKRKYTHTYNGND